MLLKEHGNRCKGKEGHNMYCGCEGALSFCNASLKSPHMQNDLPRGLACRILKVIYSVAIIKPSFPSHEMALLPSS
jgi:hypothetical protein